MHEDQQLDWRRSSFCGHGACVEVAYVEGGVLLRDGKNPDAAALRFTDEEWSAFVAGVQAGEFPS